MKKLIHISTFPILIIGMISCDRIKNKMKQVTNKVKEKIKEELKKQTQKVVEKIFPTFDHNKPNTKKNKMRFKDFLKVEITPGLKNIFCFDDAIESDVDYMFTFNCNLTSLKQIIKVHYLTVDTVSSDNRFGMQHYFEWWDKKRIKNLHKYSWTDGNSL